MAGEDVAGSEPYQAETPHAAMTKRGRGCEVGPRHRSNEALEGRVQLGRQDSRAGTVSLSAASDLNGSSART